MNQKRRSRGNKRRKASLRQKRKERRKAFLREHGWTVSILFLGMIAAVLLVCVIHGFHTDAPVQDTQEEETTNYVKAFLCADTAEIAFYTDTFEQSGTAVRGEEVTYTTQEPLEQDGVSYYMTYFPSLEYGYVREDNLTQDETGIVQEKTVYVRTPQNLRLSQETFEIGNLAEQGTELQVRSYDYLENGVVHLYEVSYGQQTGFISGQYVSASQEEATQAHDRFGDYAIHETREDVWGGGDAASLDYYPRTKASYEDNVMPDPCNCLYLTCDPAIIGNIDAYIAYAKTTNINAFVVNIMDGTSIAYNSPVFQQYSPTAYEMANNTVEEYQECIRKIKEAGFYAIGRITTFNDTFFVTDHPESSISDMSGDPLYVAGGYWPSAFCRDVWEYKVALAVEAVELMDFNEIQFDYVRFPDGTYDYEQAGTIDYKNTYDETKAQAIQRFLMYATDILHTYGVYVGADVFGETSGTYVTAYGQYWPAISNVVDVISGMPYPDHFSQNGNYLPWVHPYETIYDWAESAAKRQTETTSPAKVRTWIQAYDAIRSPYNTYGAKEVAGELLALQENGLLNGFMAWNATCSIEKMQELKPAYDALSADDVLSALRTVAGRGEDNDETGTD